MPNQETPIWETPVTILPNLDANKTDKFDSAMRSLVWRHPSIRSYYKFQNPLLPDTCWSRYFSTFGRALHGQPRVGSPQPQEIVPRPAAARQFYEWNLYLLPNQGYYMLCNVCMYVCIYIYIVTYVYISISLSIYIYTHSIYIYIYIYLHIHMYIRIQYVRIYIYIYIYIYI